MFMRTCKVEWVYNFFFFLKNFAEEIPFLKVPLHTILKLTRAAYGCEVEEIKVPVEAVDDHKLI